MNLGYLGRNSSRKRLQFACPIFIPLIGSSSRCCLKYSRVRMSDHECPRRTTSDQEWPRVVWTTNETMVLGETAFHYLFIMTNELFFQDCYGGFLLFQCAVLPSYPLHPNCTHLLSPSPITVLKIVPIRHKPVITLEEREGVL